MRLLLYSIMAGGKIMTINKIIEYILHTPLNTNRTILVEMLKELILTHGGSLTP